MKSGQLIEYIKRNISFKNDAEIEAGEPNEVKASGLHLTFNIFQ